MCFQQHKKFLTFGCSLSHASIWACYDEVMGGEISSFDMSVAASRAIKSSCSNFSTPSLLTELTPGGGLPARAVRLNDAKQRLVEQVFTLWDGSIQEACRFSSVPAEFLGALTANESGGDGAAVRFEPAVYSHLKAVALGEAARWGSITALDACAGSCAGAGASGGRSERGFPPSAFAGRPRK